MADDVPLDSPPAGFNLETPDGPRVACPICRREVAEGSMVPPFGLEVEVAILAAANTPGWEVGLGLCSGCHDRFTSAHRYLKTHYPRLARSAHPILPTAVRLGALERYKGRGVTVAFLDSGFYAHPDLTQPKSRIRAYVDVTNPKARMGDLDAPDASSWHGMMTSVAACGNGQLSGGLYRGLAPEAQVVLVKCGSSARIAHGDIRNGFEWVLRHRKRYGIRIVNVSCGGDFEESYLTDALSQACERATKEGILVVAAAGNYGHLPKHPVLPPASAPSVLTVGGLDDKNRLYFPGFEMYNSSYGPTIDALQKPEVIAPGIWVAAPILPGTSVAAQARLLANAASARDHDLRALIQAYPGADADLDAAVAIDPPLAAPLLRQVVERRIRDSNVVTAHYKHVDGTSFAAPIVTSIAAQMLEANPSLTPREVKLILVRTARRIPCVEVDRQGWGIVDAGRSVVEALALAHPPRSKRLPKAVVSLEPAQRAGGSG